MSVKRNRNIVVKSQFNINGSRGKHVGGFITDYVSRPDATSPSAAYIPPALHTPVQGDGVSFTLDKTALTRQETLDIAEHVESLHQGGKRAIQQMVISFDPDYLVEQKVVDPTAEIVRRGDYAGHYDDVRLRHAIRQGFYGLLDNDKYVDGKMIAAIQHDTTHLHVHAVLYEDGDEIGRKHGKEERGVIKESSLNQLAHNIDRELTRTQPILAPTPSQLEVTHVKKDETPRLREQEIPSMPHVDTYLELLQYTLAQQSKDEKRRREQEEQDALYARFQHELNEQHEYE